MFVTICSGLQHSLSVTKSCNPFYPVIAPQLILAMVKTKCIGYDFHPILTALADGLKC